MKAGQGQPEQRWTQQDWIRLLSGEPTPGAEVSDQEARAAIGLSAEAVWQDRGDVLIGRGCPLRQDFGNEATAELRFVPAFRLAVELTGSLHRLALSCGDPGLATELADLARSSESIACALAAGHALGYDELGVTGNLVKCREALTWTLIVTDELELLQVIHGSDKQLTATLGTAVFCRLAVEDRVQRLREHAWWDEG